jgi:hypothetical protein
MRESFYNGTQIKAQNLWQLSGMSSDKIVNSLVKKIAEVLGNYCVHELVDDDKLSTFHIYPIILLYVDLSLRAT